LSDGVDESSAARRGDAIAIVPGAGHSRRMGRPKLTLPWRLDGRAATIIERVVAALERGGVRRVFVVARGDDAELAAVVARTSARLVVPEIDPPDMRASVSAGLRAAREDGAAPGPWLVVPGDHPLFGPDTVRRLLECWGATVATPRQHSTPSVFVPVHDGQRGHPVLFAPELAACVEEIPDGAGLNWLVKGGLAARREVVVDDPGVLADLDTPADYERWRDR
jgi:molybdenum cofactor cytidylyltransferase